MNINIDFDKLKETAKDLAQTSVARAKDLTDTAIAKGKELTEIGKLKVQNASEPMTSCPDFVDDKQLDELNLNVPRREETSDEE